MQNSQSIGSSRRLIATTAACLAALVAFAAAAVPAAASSGGMVRVSQHALAGRALARATSYTATTSGASAAPSCRSYTAVGNAGSIYVQTSNGFVPWGIYMYSPANKYGHWEVDVYVGSRRVDHKSQNYEPHGTVSPKDAKPGSTFHISATETNANGTFVNVPNKCTIP